MGRQVTWQCQAGLGDSVHMCVDPFLERAAELFGGTGGNFVVQHGVEKS